MNGTQAERRSSFQKTGDAQVIQTRAKLIDSFRLAAVERRPTVSVSWICAQAGVARSTFYTHFATVEDLAVNAIAQAFAQTSVEDLARRSAAEVDRRTITRLGLESLAVAFEVSRGDIGYAMELGLRAAVVDRLVMDFTKLTRKTVALEVGSVSDASLDLMAQFIGGGTVNAFFLWLEREAPSRAELVEELLDLLPAALTR